MGLRVVGGRRATLGVLGFAIAVAGTGCGGGGKGFPDASVFFDGRPDGTTTGTGGDGADAGTRPPPTPGVGARALFTGTSLLIGSGPDSCTNQDPASGDRWCGFAALSTFANGIDLWVINVTKAAGGQIIPCDSSNLDCLLLTSTLDTSQPTSFFGDTLIYTADTDANGGGPIYAWRPGMIAGRKVTSNLGNACFGHPKSDAVICAQNQDNTTVPTQITVDLVAGKLSAGGTAALPRVATLLLSDDADPSSVPHYQISMSPGGDWVAWSTRPTAAGFETLSAQKFNDDSTRVVIAEDVSRWDFSGDGASWYWLKSYNYSASGNPLGTLQAAPFPPDPGGAATAGTTIQTRVSTFAPGGDKGVFYFGPMVNGAADLSVMADRDQPAQVKLIDRGVIQLINLSHDGRAVIYAKTVVLNTDGTPSLFDLSVGGLDLATPCTLTPTASSPFPFATLSEAPANAIWRNVNATTQEVVGNYTDLSTCRTQKFSSDLVAWTSVPSQGIIFADSLFFTSQMSADVTLRYAQYTGGALPPTGTEFQLEADATFAVTLPSLNAVIFGIFSGVAADGIYIKSDLPFTTTP
jgi:hypothetical protein